MTKLHSSLQSLYALMLCAVVGLANAADSMTNECAAPNDLDELWINFGAYSQHIYEHEEIQEYNDSNIGLGLEYRPSATYSYSIGFYRNSMYLPTHYAGVLLQPYRWGDVRLGLAVGVLDGYPAMNNGNAFLAAIPTISMEYERVGWNIFIIPPTPQIIGAVSAQLKFKIY